MSELIDTTEMYLRTIYELMEEGVLPLRARIAERLRQSGPTVSQTVARMERDGLVVLGADRQLALTARGHALAVRVMRKHRLAERLLTDVIGLDWALVHDEACRWEHVISDAVERRLVDILAAPARSPYGNPIPAIAEFGVDAAPAPVAVPLSSLLDASDAVRITLDHLSEAAQTDRGLLAVLQASGVVPGATLEAERQGGRVALRAGDEGCAIETEIAHLFFVRPAAPSEHHAAGE